MKTNKYEVKVYALFLSDDNKKHWYLLHRHTKYYTNKQKALKRFSNVNCLSGYKAVLRQKKGGCKTWRNV